MRLPVTLICLAAALTACGHTSPPATAARVPVALQIRPVDIPTSPSPLLEVQVGDVRGVVPQGWEARTLPTGAFYQQGFEASPQIAQWEAGAAGIPGIEAFWIDIGKLGIPSDFYYLAARSVSFGRLRGNLECRALPADIVVNHPPDFTGTRFSPSDYVASGRGSCVLADGKPSRWEYMVAAPGFGPTREVGIPTSGLYVVMAEVTVPHGARLLHEMMNLASFGDTTVPQLLQAAVQEQPN